MLLEILTILWSLLKPSRATIVIDKNDQQGIYLSEYCPKMEYCAEGAHTMCMYYDPMNKDKAGPRCSHFQDIQMTPEIAEHLLEIVNEVRGLVASGKEKGRNNELFPRAYGMFKLKWDSELATFAQVLANSCIFKSDLCRATKKFPNPGQVVSMTRFTLNNWQPLTAKATALPGNTLTLEKTLYGLTRAFQALYIQKTSVTPQILKKAPQNIHQYGKAYVQLIDGTSTHMGCGLSAYADYEYPAKANHTIFNIIHLVCNLSSMTRPGFPVFNMDPPPTKPGQEPDKCGCPEGIDHDDRCLCTEEITPIFTPQCGKDKSCPPAVVLLPIFTVENAPEDIYMNATRSEIAANEILDKYVTRKSKLSQRLSHKGSHNDDSESREASHSRYSASKNKYIASPKISQKHIAASQGRSAKKSVFAKAPKFQLSKDKGKPKKNSVTSRKDFSNSKQILQSYIKDKHHTAHSKKVTFRRAVLDKNKVLIPLVKPKPVQHIIQQKSAKPPVKPTTTKPTIKPIPTAHSVAKVIPKKYPPKVQPKNIPVTEIVSKKYPVAKVQPKPPPQVQSKKYPVPKVQPPMNPVAKVQPKVTLPVIPKKIPVTANIPKTAPIIPTKLKTKEINMKDHVDLKSLNEVSDLKLMSLLDTLEQEVKHIELDGNEKEIFDAKIRKIYGKVIGKSPDSLIKSKYSDSKDKFRYDTDFDDNLLSDHEDQNKNSIDKQMYEAEDRVNAVHDTGNPPHIASFYARPLPRDQHSLSPYEDKTIDHFDIRNTFDGADYKSKKHEDIKPRFQQRSEILNGHEAVKPIFQQKTGEVPRYNRPFKIVKKPKYRPSDDKRRYNHVSKVRDRYDDERGRGHYTDYEFEDDRKGYYEDVGKVKKYGDYDYDKDEGEDVLGTERRKYYQDQLDNLERKLRNPRLRSRHGEHELEHTRRIMRTRDRTPLRPSRPKSSHLYIPDRARFLHGF